MRSGSPLRQIINVGVTTGQIPDQEIVELYAQLGQLEGEVLGRINEAVEAWRRVLSVSFNACISLGSSIGRRGK